MRLINTTTLKLEEFTESRLPTYAVLSHTWEDEEVSFQDFRGLAPFKRGFTKIQNVCAQARKASYEYVWVDTCCIDKSSSADLQEAINSMHRWYRNAAMCYAFLVDVPGSCPQLRDEGSVVNSPAIDANEEPTYDSQRYWRRIFVESRWFTRGWTLQEMIAPSEVLFFGHEWNYLGSRTDLTWTISNATNIDYSILRRQMSVSSISVAARMAWASNRQTTRVEDEAYSLLGIFGVSMPMLYGEGKNAFKRLQEEIMKISTDHSIFAWGLHGHGSSGRLLATSPSDFAGGQNIVRWGRPEAFDMTNRGLRITLPLLEMARDSEGPVYVGILNCRFRNTVSGSMAIHLRKYLRRDEFRVTQAADIEYGSRLVTVSTLDMERAKASPLNITRLMESDRFRLKFWLQIKSKTHGTSDLNSNLGDWIADSLMLDVSQAIPQRCHVRASVRLLDSAGINYLLIFGFDQLGQDNAELYSLSELRPGIWARLDSDPNNMDVSFVKPFDGPKCKHVDLEGNGVSPTVELCPEAGPFTAGCQRCLRMPTHTEIGQPSAELSASIENREIMGESVLVVTVHVG